MAPLTIADARVLGPALVALMYFPSHIQNLFSRGIRPFLRSPRLVKILKVLVGLDLLRKSSNTLSRWASNNFNRVIFRPSSELVLISGGCSGLGLLMAKEFAKRGVKVVILDLNPPQESIPVNIFFYKCDITNVSEITETAASIRKNHGDPTVLINNAGIGTVTSILASTEKNILKIFGVNTMSHFWMVREFLPAMIKRNHGHVVTIASLASYFVHAMNVDYCCTKSSALAFHEGLSSELKNVYNAPKVRTTVVNPSWIRTNLTKPLYNDNNWRSPLMEPEYVILKIVDQVMSGQGGQIVLPPKLNILTTIRSWPLWAQLFLRNFLGKELKLVRDSIDAKAATVAAPVTSITLSEAPPDSPRFEAPRMGL